MGRISGNESRLRLLYVYQYLMENTDPDHPVLIKEILEMLCEKHGIEANRNTVSDDLEAIVESGLPIEKDQLGRSGYYYNGFCMEGCEIRVLVDAVASSRTISEKQSSVLIDKLLSFTSIQEAERIRGNAYPWKWNKSGNEKLYYILDNIGSAIEKHKYIRFLYAVSDGQSDRKVVSPFRIIWDGNYYYVLGFVSGENEAKAYRLDRMQEGVEVLQKNARVRRIPDDEEWYRTLLKTA